MDKFPRTVVGGVSLPRLICGTNWILGYSHTSSAQNKFIKEIMDEKNVVDIFLTFLKYDINAVMGPPSDFLVKCIKKAEDKSGKKIVYICTPWKIEEIEWAKENGATFCFPHQTVTDSFINRIEKNIKGIEVWLKKIRDAGLIPGLSTHTPEAIIYSDKENLDVESYIQIYNVLGFLCQVEIEWIHKVISEAKKPVMIIKPLAAGRISPFAGLVFVWNTIREIDMVTIGCMSSYEVEEDINISLSILEKKKMDIELQKTRSKKSLEI
ncbi:hypothetical protein J7L87_06275 [bacterium]|nr:hypothetical protein [bacterium]